MGPAEDSIVPQQCITYCVRFVLSALGLFALTPGVPSYVLGSPVFRHLRISRCASRNAFHTFYETPVPAEGHLF